MPFILTLIISFLPLLAGNLALETTPSYWLNHIKGRTTPYGYFEYSRFLFVSDKGAPNLSLYDLRGFGFKKLGASDALVAKGRGAKKKEGDLTTPIGAYRINARFTKLTPYYGPLALSTNYPSTYDKSLGRTGSGIWIHGRPLDGKREPYTRGCVVIDNDLLQKYDSLIDWKRSMLIVHEGGAATTSEEELARLLAWLHRWREALQNRNLEAYLSFYSPNFRAADTSDFAALKARVALDFAKATSKRLEISRLDLAIYPNESSQKMFFIGFQLKTKGKSINKELFVLLDNEEFKIISESGILH